MNRSPVDGGRVAASQPEVIFLHNADLVRTGVWTPRPEPTTPAPLPIYPQPFDALFDEIDGLIARVRQMAAECPPPYDRLERRGRGGES